MEVRDLKGQIRNHSILNVAATLLHIPPISKEEIQRIKQLVEIDHKTAIEIVDYTLKYTGEALISKLKQIAQKLEVKEENEDNILMDRV